MWRSAGGATHDKVLARARRGARVHARLERSGAVGAAQAETCGGGAAVGDEPVGPGVVGVVAGAAGGLRRCQRGRGRRNAQRNRNVAKIGENEQNAVATHIASGLGQRRGGGVETQVRARAAVDGAGHEAHRGVVLRSHEGGTRQCGKKGEGGAHRVVLSEDGDGGRRMSTSEVLRCFIYSPQHRQLLAVGGSSGRHYIGPLNNVGYRTLAQLFSTRYTLG